MMKRPGLMLAVSKDDNDDLDELPPSLQNNNIEKVEEKEEEK